MRTKYLVLKLLPFYVLVFGLLIFPFWKAENSRIDAQEALGYAFEEQAIENQLQREATTVEGQPTYLEIPSVNVSINVTIGKYDVDSQSWTLSNDKAHVALESPTLSNRVGGTVVYGHNTLPVFYKTKDLQLGDRMVVHGTNGVVFEYFYSSDEFVDPSDTSVFDYKGRPAVFLLSCSGTWSQERRIMKFEFLREIEV